MELLAILGRGIQMVGEAGPWTPTEDLEICDERSAHLAVRVPADDSSPCCMVGGGELNLLAGLTLIKSFNPRLIVCAYGDRLGYLKSIDAPSESMVMSDWLIEQGVHSSLIAIWTKKMTAHGPSNTGRELLNIFELAMRWECFEIGIVSVGVHMPRTMTYAMRHLALPYYQSRSLRFFESENVLLGADKMVYGPRVERLRNSQAFRRTWEREALGTRKILRNEYGDEKPFVSLT